MISLSHERQCFFAPTMLGMTPTTCIRFAVLSRIEILHILLEHFYDSRRNENAAQLADFISAASREKPGAALSAPAVPAAGPVVGSVAHLVAKDLGSLLADIPRQRRW